MTKFITLIKQNISKFTRRTTRVLLGRCYILRLLFKKRNYRRLPKQEGSVISAFDKGKGKDIGYYIGKFPDEIIILIVSHLPNYTAQDLRFLKELSLISYAFRTACQKVLFRHVTTHPFDSFFDQATTIIANPYHVAVHIRVLSICPRTITPYIQDQRDIMYEWQPRTELGAWCQAEQAKTLLVLIDTCKHVLEEIRLLFCGEGNGGLIEGHSQRGLAMVFASALGRYEMGKLRKVVLWKCDQTMMELLVNYEETYSAIFFRPLGQDYFHDLPLFSKATLERNYSRIKCIEGVNWRYRQGHNPAQKVLTTFENIDDDGLRQTQPLLSPLSLCKTPSARTSLLHGCIRTPMWIFDNPSQTSQLRLNLTSLSILSNTFYHTLSLVFSDPALVVHLRKLELVRLKLDCGNIAAFEDADHQIIWQTVFQNIVTNATSLVQFKVQELSYKFLRAPVKDHVVAMYTWEGKGWDEDKKSLKALWAAVRNRRGKIIEAGAATKDLEEMGEMDAVERVKHTTS